MAAHTLPHSIKIRYVYYSCLPLTSGSIVCLALVDHCLGHSPEALITCLAQMAVIIYLGKPPPASLIWMTALMRQAIYTVLVLVGLCACVCPEVGGGGDWFVCMGEG